MCVSLGNTLEKAETGNAMYFLDFICVMAFGDEKEALHLMCMLNLVPKQR